LGPPPPPPLPARARTPCGLSGPWGTPAQLYDDGDLARCKLALLTKTSMVDSAIAAHREVHGTSDVPAELVARRERVLARLTQLGDECQDVMALFRDPAVVERLSQDRQFNLRFLQDNYGLKPERVQSLYLYAKLQFDCGNYAAAAELLYHYRVLSLDTDKSLSALWGKLASEILLQKYDAAVEDLNTLRQLIENRVRMRRP
jgi:translation initiation factor 3 subunit E